MSAAVHREPARWLLLHAVRCGRGGQGNADAWEVSVVHCLPPVVKQQIVVPHPSGSCAVAAAASLCAKQTRAVVPRWCRVGGRRTLCSARQRESAGLRSAKRSSAAAPRRSLDSGGRPLGAAARRAPGLGNGDSGPCGAPAGGATLVQGKQLSPRVCSCAVVSVPPAWDRPGTSLSSERTPHGIKIFSSQSMH